MPQEEDTIRDYIESKNSVSPSFSWGDLCLLGPGEVTKKLSLHCKPTLSEIGNVITNTFEDYNNYLETRFFQKKSEQELITIDERFQLAVIELLKTYRGDIDVIFSELKYRRKWNILAAAIAMKYNIVTLYLLTERRADPNHIIPGTGPIYYYIQHHSQLDYLGEIQKEPRGFIPLMMTLFENIENENYIRSNDSGIGLLRDQRNANLVFYATKWSSDEHFSYIQSVADIRHINSFGETAISSAANDQRGDFITKLICAGVDPTLKDRKNLERMMPNYIPPVIS